MRLNIGTYQDYRTGWLNLDLFATCDVKADCFRPLPFKNNSFDYIRASHVLEHTEKPKEFLRELHRIGRNGATVEIIVPHFNATAAILEHPRLYGCKAFQDEWLNQAFSWGEQQVKFKSRRILWQLLVGKGWPGDIVNAILSLNPFLLERFLTLPGQVVAELEVVK